MAQTLVSIYLHIIFSTKLRQKLIPVELEAELYKYVGGIRRNLDCTLLEGDGMDDHSHCLVSMTKNVSVKHLQQEIKKSSSKWINGKTKFNFSWQGGYGAFSVSPSQLQTVRQYIRNQKTHHKNMSFEQEYEEILKKHGCEYDEKYFLRLTSDAIVAVGQCVSRLTNGYVGNVFSTLKASNSDPSRSTPSASTLDCGSNTGFWFGKIIR